MSEDKKKDKEEKVVNPIEALFDETNTSPISLFSEKGEEVKFEQIAIIPLETAIYAILKPINKMEDIGEDEALVFEIVEEASEEENMMEGYLKLVSDIDVIDKVFEVYNHLMDEEEEKEKIDSNKGNK